VRHPGGRFPAHAIDRLIRLHPGAAIGRPRNVYYCQDCGGANPANATICRICGLQLIRERNGPPCQSCGSPTVVDATFCSLCGSTTVAAAMASAASVLPGSLKVDAAVAEERQASAARLNATLNLGEDLELPDWLKRAAAEQPFDPSRQTAISANPFGPPAGTTATVATPPMAAGNGMPIGNATPPTVPHLPTAGDDVVATAPAAAPAPVRDVTDTSSFISEEDLPEWIRQLAAADAVKKAEEERLAAEAATEQGKAAGAADSRRRQPLPGETTATGPAASPWLARRERAEVPETVAADSWGAPAPAATAGTARGEATAEPVTIPASTPEPVVAEQVVAPVVTPAAKQPNQLRLVLVAALVLMVVALIAFMALS
jgi:ribosomal protein L40E